MCVATALSAAASPARWGYVSSKFVILFGEVCKFRTVENVEMAEEQA